MSEIDERLRDHYRTLELSSADMQEITCSEGKRGTARERFPARKSRTFAWAAAALLLLSVSVGVHEYGTHSERTNRTLNEAAMNHSTRLELEFTGNTLVQIDEHMSQLPFKVRLPAEFGRQYNVVGARYCTINGELAAHVKFIDPESDKQISLFMTRSVDELKRVNVAKEQVAGVSVSLWNESGLFYAMASRLPDSAQK